MVSMMVNAKVVSTNNLLQRCTLRSDAWTKSRISWDRLLLGVASMVKESWLSLRRGCDRDDGFCYNCDQVGTCSAVWCLRGDQSI